MNEDQRRVFVVTALFETERSTLVVVYSTLISCSALESSRQHPHYNDGTTCDCLPPREVIFYVAQEVLVLAPYR
jgi:hypothetical protein